MNQEAVDLRCMIRMREKRGSLKEDVCLLEGKRGSPRGERHQTNARVRWEKRSYGND